MFKFSKKPQTTGLGQEFKAGQDHYRAYVGPPRDYDLVAAMVFNLLTCAGLRQQHRLIDIGCGSLRNGRLLIPYLNPGNYIGLEPNRWLVQDGILNEVGEDQIKIKRPVFSYKASFEDFKSPLNADYAVAQSIFSHCGMDFIDAWLRQTGMHLAPTGALFATFLVGDDDFQGTGWGYNRHIAYRIDTMAKHAESNGFKLTMLDWKHPRQRWALFARSGFDHSCLLNGNTVSWNHVRGG